MAGASVASRRLDAPNISRRGMPVACRDPGDRNVNRYERVAWQKEGSGQGLQATRWRVRSGGCVVAAGMARCAAPRAASGKFESERFCADNRVTALCDVGCAYFCSSLLLETLICGP